MVKPTYAVRTEGGLVVLTTVGSPDAETIEIMRQDLEDALKRVPAPRNVLVLAEGSGLLMGQAREAAIAGLLTMSFHHMAVVSGHPDRLDSARAVTKGVKDTERFKVFRSEEDAREWLDSKE